MLTLANAALGALVRNAMLSNHSGTPGGNASNQGNPQGRPLETCPSRHTTTRRLCSPRAEKTHILRPEWAPCDAAAATTPQEGSRCGNPRSEAACSSMPNAVHSFWAQRAAVAR
eukprot:TRINITY_DN19414_c0_g1_i1.p3 TRINITY_DN19414_c0_g1~~TRINITY_DN19414_c0_g1_i1.p3  ORF type:complete len:114 (-),score=3.46 TRINITY_DN19414_c0_g1_i1:106-447(-)